MKYQLHYYQQQAIDEVTAKISEGINRTILTMPTGSGKTMTAAALAHEYAQRGERTLWVVDRVELVFQAAECLAGYGLRVGILQGENTDMRPTDEVTVASIQTIHSRGVGCPGLLVIDECHILYKAHIELMKQFFYIPTVGLSATPMRKDLGQHFDALVRGPTVRELMESGALVGKVHAYCPSADAMRKALDTVSTTKGDFKNDQLSQVMNRKELVGDIVGTWQKKAPHRQTLCFAVDIAHSKAIVEDFRNAGVHVEHLDCFTDSMERHRIIQAFRDHDIQILSSVNVLGIGFDVPAASCAILARPTLSEILSMQQVGRVLRRCDGKESAILLDHAGNTLRFGLPQDFTVPDLNDEDYASTRSKRKQKKAAACKECGYVLEPGQMTCPACGFDRPQRMADVHYLNGSLIKYGEDSDGTEHHAGEQEKGWYLALLWKARHMTKKDGTPYSDKWAAHAWREKFKTDKFPPWAWLREAPAIPNEEQQRWIKYYQIRQYHAWKKQRSA